ncbi:hypothetical protein DFH06DRAFT_1347219 [Mycena polygramma]|nr:hypothetical protein DFH06DRAFT_1347219 [Mycena polygramma]
MPSQQHAWSYRTGDDKDGISPYGGETCWSRWPSGAEYDLDCPLHDMMAAVDPKLSMFDMDPSRSRYKAAFNSIQSWPVGPRPLIRLRATGFAIPLSAHPLSPLLCHLLVFLRLREPPLPLDGRSLIEDVNESEAEPFDPASIIGSR